MIAPASPGGGGPLFQRPDNLRSDARLAAKMISLGVVSEEQAEALLRAGFSLAAQCSKTNPRGYAAAMKIILACAKLEQDERKNERDERSSKTSQHLHLYGAPAVNVDPDYADFIRARLASVHSLPGGGGALDDAGAVDAGQAPAAPGQAAHGPHGGKANGHNGNGKN